MTTTYGVAATAAAAAADATVATIAATHATPIALASFETIQGPSVAATGISYGAVAFQTQCWQRGAWRIQPDALISVIGGTWYKFPQ